MIEDTIRAAFQALPFYQEGDSIHIVDLDAQGIEGLSGIHISYHAQALRSGQSELGTFISFIILPESGETTNLFIQVDPAFRKKGYANMLLGVHKAICVGQELHTSKFPMDQNQDPSFWSHQGYMPSGGYLVKQIKKE